MSAFTSGLQFGLSIGVTSLLTAPLAADALLLEDGDGILQLEDGAGNLELED